MILRSVIYNKERTMRKDSNKLLLLVVCIVISTSNAHGSSIAKNGTLQHRNETLYAETSTVSGPCSPNPCKNDGACSVDGGNYICDCIKPYSGKQCENHPCHSHPCENEGACISIENGYGCVCQEPFFGRHCENDPCSSNPCLNGGACSIQGIAFSCSCKKPFSGKQCENFVSESTPSPTDFQEYKTTVQDCYCGKNSISCKFYNSSYNVCNCKPGYDQRNKSCSKTCFQNSQCLNDGFCNLEYDRFFCQCQSTFIGDYCETDLCETLRSRCDAMRATCKRVGDTGAECECPKERVYNYQSNVCEEKCGPRTCVFGRCVITGRTEKCVCNTGFTGPRCDQETREYLVAPMAPKILFIILCIAIVAFSIATICIFSQIKRLNKTKYGHVVKGVGP